MMSSNNQKNTPSGLYLLSGFIILSIPGILYHAITVSSYVYLAIVLIPLFIYMSIGIIKRWPGTRQTVMVVAMIFFIGAFTDIIVTLFVEEAQGITSGLGMKILLG